MSTIEKLKLMDSIKAENDARWKQFRRASRWKKAERALNDVCMVLFILTVIIGSAALIDMMIIMCNGWMW